MNKTYPLHLKYTCIYIHKHTELKFKTQIILRILRTWDVSILSS